MLAGSLGDGEVRGWRRGGDNNVGAVKLSKWLEGTLAVGAAAQRRRMPQHCQLARPPAAGALQRGRQDRSPAL